VAQEFKEATSRSLVQYIILSFKIDLQYIKLILSFSDEKFKIFLDVKFLRHTLNYKKTIYNLSKQIIVKNFFSELRSR
jgi:hypothetical protein